MRLPKAQQAQKVEQQQQQQQVWHSLDELLADHLDEVLNKWNTLNANDDIWAKLIYFEGSTRLAKAYVSAPALTVDSSTSGLGSAHNLRIGLSGLDNSRRGLDSVACLRALGAGVELRVDGAGSALITRAAATFAPVFVADWPLPTGAGATTALAADEPREVCSPDKSYKLFDMRKFRNKLGALRAANRLHDAWPLCVSIVSFVRDKKLNTEQLLDNPSWLLVINVIAVDLLRRLTGDRRLQTAMHRTSVANTIGQHQQHYRRQDLMSASQQSSGFQSSLSASSVGSSSGSGGGVNASSTRHATPAVTRPKHHKSAQQLASEWRAPRPRLAANGGRNHQYHQNNAQNLSCSNLDLHKTRYLKMNYEDDDQHLDDYSNIDAEIDRHFEYLSRLPPPSGRQKQQTANNRHKNHKQERLGFVAAPNTKNALKQDAELRHQKSSSACCSTDSSSFEPIDSATTNSNEHNQQRLKKISVFSNGSASSTTVSSSSSSSGCGADYSLPSDGSKALASADCEGTAAVVVAADHDDEQHCTCRDCCADCFDCCSPLEHAKDVQTSGDIKKNNHKLAAAVKNGATNGTQNYDGRHYSIIGGVDSKKQAPAGSWLSRKILPRFMQAPQRNRMPPNSNSSSRPMVGRI